MPAPIRSAINRRPSVVLVTASGCPGQISNFMPDNGLATLAAILKQAGISVRVLDFNTLSHMKKYITPELQQELVQTMQRVFDLTKDGIPKLGKGLATLGFLARKLQHIERKMIALRPRVNAELAAEIADTVREREATLVGFKTFHGPGSSGPIEMALNLRQQFPDLLLAAGGPQASLFNRRILDLNLDQGAFDVIAAGGDGEAMIVSLAEASVGKPLTEVPGIYYCDEDGAVKMTDPRVIEDLNMIPAADYGADVYPAMHLPGNEKMWILVVEDAKGCSHGCPFCTHGTIWGKVRRQRSVTKIVDEMEMAVKKYGVRAFRLAGSSAPNRFLRELSAEIIRRDLKIKWTTFARTDIDSSIFPQLKESGCVSIFFGVESGDQDVLDGMGKRVTVEQIKRTIKDCNAAGIKAVGSIIHPAPFSTPETETKNFELVRESDLRYVLSQFTGLFPGTPYAANPGKYGIKIKYPSRLLNVLARAGLISPANYYDPVIQEYLFGYEMKRLAKPPSWEPTPWEYDYGFGLRGFSHYAKVTDRFQMKMRAQGRLYLTDEELLMADMAGHEPGGFGAESTIAVRSVDIDATRELLQKINQGNSQIG